jgi:hypothetical protein
MIPTALQQEACHENSPANAPEFSLRAPPRRAARADHAHAVRGGCTGLGAWPA